MMAKEILLDSALTESPPRASAWKHILKTFVSRKVVILGLVIILVTVITAIFAPLLAPYDPNLAYVDNRLLKPSSQHILGTDSLGRDTLSRIMYGSRTSLIIGISALLIGSLIGMTLGLIAGYFGGFAHLIIMRFIDSLMSFPLILLALILAMLLGQGMRNIILALGIGLTSTYARLMCAQVLSVKENDYITAARSIGSRNLRIMLAHVLPNCFPPLIVMVTLMLGSTILAEASLSFIGISIPPPTPAWGAMVNDGYRYILTNPMLSFAPGLAIMLLVFAFNMVGDGLRDALDPKLRGTL